MATTSELILKFSGDPRHLQQTIAAVRADLSRLAQLEAAGARDAGRLKVTETNRAEQQRIAATIRSANQRLREEQRSAREVTRIIAETARQAAAQERVRERAAKQLADVQVREAKRAAKELEKSLAAGRSGGGGFDITSVFGNVPQLSGLTSQFSALTSQATSAATAVGAVGAAIGIMVAGAAVGIGVLVKLGAEIFELTKKTAEFEGKFFDLSQQVGVNVETLSALDVAAQRTGGNIETVTASLGIFQKGLENAHDPTTEEAKLLKELGVTSLDTEVALRQTIAGLFKMGETQKQTDSVLQLFGRSGRFVNAILKESKGDLDQAAKGFRGMLITREAAAAADEFNDSFGDTQRLLASVSRTLVHDTIPVFTVFFQDLNKGLTGNQDDWSFWADLIKVEVAGVLGTLQGFVLYVRSGFAVSLGIAIDTSIRSLLERSEQLKNRLRFESDAERIQKITGSILAGKPGDRPDPDKGSSEAQARAAKFIQNQQRLIEETTRAHRVKLERERELDLKSIDEWESQSITALLAHQNDQTKIFDQEARDIRTFVKKREDQLLAETALQLKRIALSNQTLEELQRVQDEANKRRNQAELNLNQQLLKIRDAQRDEEQRQIKQDLDNQFITESGAIQRQQALLKQAFDDRNVLRDQELSQATTSTERHIQLTNEKIEAEIRYTTEFKRLTAERIKALIEEGATGTPRLGPLPKEAPPIFIDPDTLGAVPEALGEWTIALETAREGFRALQEEMRSFGAFAGSTIVGTIEGIAGAVADSTVAWALYGESFGQAMRKGIAAVAARVAGEAAFQGALHAAYAIGSLAFGDFRGAATHGLAAAKFFALAAVTGLAARAIAGNSFKGSGGGGGASSGSSGSGSTGSRSTSGSTEPQPVEINRSVRGSQAVEVNINIRRDPGSIVEAVVQNHGHNGEIRRMIQSEIGT